MRALSLALCAISLPLVTVTASPKIQTSDDVVIVKSEDLRWTDENNYTVSLSNMASRLEELEQWRSIMESTSTSCPAGEVVVSTTATGGQACSGDLQRSIMAVNSSITSSINGLSDDIVGVDGRLSTQSSLVGSVQEAINVLQTNISRATSLANTNAGGIITVSSRLGNLTSAFDDLEGNLACVVPTKVSAGSFTYRGVTSGPGRRSNRGLTSGSNVWGAISCAHHCNDAFDGRYGLWGPDGSTYRANNGQGGGIEIRFENPVKIAKWVAMCIRNTGTWQGNNNRGTACYANGAYDFTGVYVEYWDNNRWNIAKRLNGRNSGNWVDEYEGSGRSQNWRFYFSGGGTTGRCQHANGDCAPHISEIDVYIC